jgi:hypothetical protein
MPQQDMSSKICKSPSPSIQRVIENNKDVQRVVPVGEATKPEVQYNKRNIVLGK